jgi:hypothetical protein
MLEEKNQISLQIEEKNEGKRAISCESEIVYVTPWSSDEI